MEYPKKGCDVGYFWAQEPINNRFTILRRSSVTKPCFLSIGLRSDRWPKVPRSRPKRTCIFLKKWSLAAARDKFCDSTGFCQLGVSQKWLLCGILLKALKRRQKESNLNDFCRFPCTGHGKFTVWNGVSQKRLLCGILFITQLPIAKVGWDCSESKGMPT